jgi:membrane protein
MPEVGGRRLVERVERLVMLARAGITSALRMWEGESVRLRAMALTYTTLFALVPAMVVAFSVVNAFAGMGGISDRVHDFLLENLAVGARESIAPYLDRFVANAHLTSAGLIGAAILVYSGISLFQDVERAINDIWSIKRRRSIRQQVIIYWVGLTLGPLLLAGSVMAGHTARTWLVAGSGVRALGVGAGVLLTCSFFTVIYFIVPATKVQLKAAALGGLLAGVAWEIAKWGYAIFVGRSVRYHAIYGSVAAVPIFLLWLYVSWTLLLFGAKLAFIIQHASALLRMRPLAATHAGREYLAGEAMLRIALAFDRSLPPPTDDDIASDAQALAEDVGEVLAQLRQAGLIVPVSEGGLVPSRPLERITLLDVRRAVHGPGAELSEEADVGRILKDVEGEAERRLADVNFRALVARASQSPYPPEVEALVAAKSP